MIPRKTFPVDEFHASMNLRIRDSTCTPLERRVMCSILEEVLMNSGRYAGFRYLDLIMDGNDVVTLGDESRRHYFITP